ncbi:integrase domain-containing protein [Vibrio sp. R78045]
MKLDGREQNIADEHIRDALRLQEQFGLRREEALKFKPELAARDDNYVTLQSSWCKGGRERSIPILKDSQRELLAELNAKYPTGSLIHKHMSYKEMRDKYDNAVKSVGLGKCHGLRHAYAQARYEELSSRECSVKGGLTRAELTKEQREEDFVVRLKVSEELGHSRVDVVAQYIGS